MEKPAFKCKNVVWSTHSTHNLSRQKLLQWITASSGLKIKKVESLSSGAVYCKVMNSMFPGCLSMKKIKLDASVEYDCYSNFKQLQYAFKKVGCDKDVPIDRLIKGRFQENFEFLQWFYMFVVANLADNHPDVIPNRNIVLREDFPMFVQASVDERKTLEECAPPKGHPDIISEGQQSDEGQYSLPVHMTVNDLKEQHEKYVDDTAIEKKIKVQDDEEFQVQKEHNVDIDILTQEKEILRERLVSAVDDLIQTHQKQQDKLINAHQEEVAALRKQISSLESECEEKNEVFIAEKKKIEGEFKQQISSLETSIEELKQQLLDNDSIIASLEEKIHQYESEKEKILQEHMQAEQRLKDEIENINLENTRNYKDLQSELKDLREFKESAEENENRLKLEIRDIEDENKKLSKELYEEKSSVSVLEEKISLLQDQLNKSLQDSKQQLKMKQAEIDEANQQINVLENTGSKRQATIVDLKNNLKEIEKYYSDLKREVSILRNQLNMDKSKLNLREQEIAELVAVRNKDEAKEDELKKEILSLKQKLSESSALKQSMEEATKEIHAVKLFNIEEGKILALEARVVKLDECAGSAAASKKTSDKVHQLKSEHDADVATAEETAKVDS